MELRTHSETFTLISCCPDGILAQVSSSMLWPPSKTDATKGSRPGKVPQSQEQCIFIGCATESILVLLEEAQAVR